MLYEESRVRVILRLAVYRQSVHLGILADERFGLSFTIAAGPRRDTWPHFTVSDSRLPQPGGPGPRIYIPQEQGSPVIPPGTGFPFHRLLRLSGLRWRYSTTPPHENFSLLSLSLIRPTVSLPVCLRIKHPFGAYDQIFITVRQLWVCWCGALSLSLWREDGSVVYNCCWPSPAQSFSRPSPVGLGFLFLCLRLVFSVFVASCDS
jgi:hypothetical protein